MRKILIGIAVLLVACIVFAIIGALTGGGKKAAPPAPVAVSSTLQPAPVKPTRPASATAVALSPTQIPLTATPVPTLSPADQLAAVAGKVLSDRVRSAELDPAVGVALVEYNLGGTWDESTAVRQVSQDFKRLAPEVFKIPTAERFQLRCYTDFTDKYGKTTSEVASNFTIKRDLAAKIQWDNVDPRNFGDLLASEPSNQLYVHPALKDALTKYQQGQ